jgi:hypothetical protein
MPAPPTTVLRERKEVYYRWSFRNFAMTGINPDRRLSFRPGRHFAASAPTQGRTPGVSIGIPRARDIK